jgi:hypothetical protein
LSRTLQAYNCEEVLMDWIVRTDQRDNRGGERHYDTEPNFVSGVNELLNNRERIVSATLPGGVILDEEKLRQLMRRSFGRSFAS